MVDNWLKEDSSNYICLESYLSSLIHINKLNLAKELINTYIDQKIEYDFDTLHLFRTLALYYKLTKDDKNRDLYQNKLNTFHNSFLKTIFLHQSKYPKLLIKKEPKKVKRFDINLNIKNKNLITI